MKIQPRQQKMQNGTEGHRRDHVVGHEDTPRSDVHPGEDVTVNPQDPQGSNGSRGPSQEVSPENPRGGTLDDQRG